MMGYLILTIIVLIGCVLLLNVRVRVRLDSDRRIIFIGLGQSGVEKDTSSQITYLKIFGFRIKTFIGSEKKEKISVIPKSTEKKAVKIASRKHSREDLIIILPQCSKAVFSYLIGLIKSLAIEELEGEIEAGFDSPDITGRVFGYYQAVLGAVPAIEGHFRYYPVWNEASFSGSLRLSIALPLYKLVYRTLILISKLPLRKILKLAIGTKKGEQDVK